jgi:hypothetical protein
MGYPFPHPLPWDVKPMLITKSFKQDWNDRMTDRRFMVRFKPAELTPQLVVAERAEFQGEHLVFLNSAGEFVALFVVDIVESWSELE